MRRSKKLLRKLSPIAIIFLVSCTTIKEVPVIVEVPILPLPELPKLTPEQEQQIPDDSYSILVERDATWRAHVERINKILEIHNQQEANNGSR